MVKYTRDVLGQGDILALPNGMAIPRDIIEFVDVKAVAFVRDNLEQEFLLFQFSEDLEVSSSLV